MHSNTLIVALLTSAALAAQTPQVPHNNIDASITNIPEEVQQIILSMAAGSLNQTRLVSRSWNTLSAAIRADLERTAEQMFDRIKHLFDESMPNLHEGIKAMSEEWNNLSVSPMCEAEKMVVANRFVRRVLHHNSNIVQRLPLLICHSTEDVLPEDLAASLFIQCYKRVDRKTAVRYMAILVNGAELHDDKKEYARNVARKVCHALDILIEELADAEASDFWTMFTIAADELTTTF